MKLIFSALLALLASSMPALATTTPAASDIVVSSPANGASITSPFTLAASTTVCAGVPATAMGYSIDGGTTKKAPTAFSITVAKNLGKHTIAVKCYAQNVQYQLSLTVKVVAPPSAATPQFS